MAKSLRRAGRREYDILVASGEGVAARWRKNYTDQSRTLAGGETVGQIQKALDALPEDADPQMFVNVVGNQSWTHPICDCCNEYVERAVSVGDDPSVCICLPCLEFLVKELPIAR